MEGFEIILNDVGIVLMLDFENLPGNDSGIFVRSYGDCLLKQDSALVVFLIDQMNGYTGLNVTGFTYSFMNKVAIHTLTTKGR